MIDLREENRKLRGDLKTAFAEVEALRVEVARLRASQVVQGVPAGCVVIPLSETDLETLCTVHGRPM